MCISIYREGLMYCYTLYVIENQMNIKSTLEHLIHILKSLSYQNSTADFALTLAVAKKVDLIPIDEILEFIIIKIYN